MPRYYVSVIQELTREVTYEVEADSKEVAIEKARARAGYDLRPVMDSGEEVDRELWGEVCPEQDVELAD